jgi:triphosphatase
MSGSVARTSAHNGAAHAHASDDRSREVHSAGPEVEPMNAEPPGLPEGAMPEEEPAAPPTAAPRGRPVDAGTETELRLLVAPDRLAELDQARPILALARSKGTVRHLTTVYFDTPGRALYRAGFTLRLRQSGRQVVQTLKTRAETAPLRRGEWESPVAAMAPELPLLLPLIGSELTDLLAHEPLQPAFTTQVRRHLRRLKLPAGEIEIAVDRGTITAGERSAEISEIELELKRGDRAALYGIALALSDICALRPTTLSKAERGFALAFDRPPPVSKAGHPAITDDMPADDAFAAILQSALDQLLANVPAAVDGRDPEGVHQMRVALRRLRSALGLLEDLAPSPTIAELRAEAKWLAGSFGEPRNWDVFLGETLRQTADGCGPLAGLEDLRVAAENHRAAGYAAARRALDQRRAGRLPLALGAFIEARGWRSDVPSDHLAVLAGPVVAVAQQALARQHRKVRKRGRGFKRLPPEARHKLRLAVKRLRYTLDFFLGLFDHRRPARRYAKALAVLQEHLGRYNDMATTRDLTARFAADAMPAAGREALGAVIGWQAHAVVGAESELRAAWRVFRDATVPWPEPEPQ